MSTELKVGDVVTVYTPWHEGDLGVIKEIEGESYMVQLVKSDGTVELFADELELTENHGLSDYYLGLLGG